MAGAIQVIHAPVQPSTCGVGSSIFAYRNLQAPAVPARSPSVIDTTPAQQRDGKLPQALKVCVQLCNCLHAAFDPSPACPGSARAAYYLVAALHLKVYICSCACTGRRHRYRRGLNLAQRLTSSCGEGALPSFVFHMLAVRCCNPQGPIVCISHQVLTKLGWYAA